MSRKFCRTASICVVSILLFQVCLFIKAEEKSNKKPRNVVVKYEPAKEKKYRLIPLATIGYKAIKQICGQMLSKDGILTYEKNRNSILVYDTPEVIEKIEKFIRDTDREAVNIRISIDFINSGSTREDIASVRGKHGKDRHNPPIVFKDGKFQKTKNIHVNIARRRGASSNNVSQFIVTQSGSPASLWVGKTQVDPSWLNNVVIRPNIVILNSGGSAIVIPTVDTDIQWADIGSSLYVTPYYHDNGTIDVEVYPVVSFIDGKGRKRAVKVQQISTKIQVKDGSRIYIGGVISSNKKMYTQLFGPDFFRRKDGSSALDMYLTATAITPSGRQKNKQDGRPAFRFR